jgi:hypothetical protein
MMIQPFLFTRHNHACEVHHISKKVALYSGGGGDLNVFEKSRGSQRKIWHHMLFITHVRGTWIEIINERVPCFCNLPDSMKVITLLGK